MDKNLINIDDLVRQRLMGGEEKERAGAWLRMSELLEEEMPQRPAGFYWRRMFGAMAILLLISAASLGGYEMYAHRQPAGSDAAIAATAINAPASANVSNTTAATADNANNNQLTTPAATGSSNEKNNLNNTDKTNKPIVANSNNVNNKESKKQLHKKVFTTANAATDNTVTNNTVANNMQPGTTRQVAANTANNNTTDKRAIAHVTATKTADNSKEKIAGNTAGKNDIAVSENKTGKHISNHKKTNSVAETTPVGNNDAKGTDVAKTNNKTKGTDVAITNNKTKKTDVTTTNNNTKGTDVATTNNNTKGTDVATTRNTRKHKTHKTATVSKDKLVLSSNAPKAMAPKAGVTNDSKGPVKHLANKAGANTLALNNNTTRAKHAPVAGKIVDKTNKPTVHKTNTNGDKVATTSPVSKKGGTKTVKANKTANKSATPVADTKNTGDETAGTNTPQMGKRVIQKLVINQRTMRISAKETVIRMDTISLENITEMFELSTALKTNDPNGAKKGGSGELAANTQSDNDNANSTAIKPAASSSENESTGTKVNNTTTKSKGAKTMENLSAAFNDIKYSAGHAQFATGLTGGVNGTFLGPNSFKGFQFGVTGKFIFSDALAIMGELKYFHRINNGYSLNDNYYSYTPVANGYSKVLVENPYAISTLHSLELPITVRYCISSFNFFAGGNFVYTFPINTGDYPTTVQPTTPNIVSTMGNDNAPKIKANDFNSRFGLGYTFGASFQVSPKVMIDFRDVQTFWDNAKTPGAKYISSQLYKSPSFQLSLDYRLGGKKKDKE